MIELQDKGNSQLRNFNNRHTDTGWKHAPCKPIFSSGKKLVMTRLEQVRASQERVISVQGVQHYLVLFVLLHRRDKIREFPIYHLTKTAFCEEAWRS